MAKRKSSLESVEMKKRQDADFWVDRPVLVTGATGLLGSWLTKKLVELGAELVCLVRDWIPESELLRSQSIERVRVVRGHVQDLALLERILGEYEIDTVFHLAAQTIVTIANRNPISTFGTNIGGTWTLLEASRRSPTVKQVVVTSSDKAYGEHEALPYLENYPLQGRYAYDVSKSCADLIAQSYSLTFGLPVAITRCGNFFGGGDLNWNRIVPGTIRSVLRGRRPVVRSDGRHIRDYFYVEDAVAANMLLAERLAESRSLSGSAFNFSFERPLSVLEMVHLILNLMSSSLQPDVRNEYTCEIEKQYLSAEKAKTVLGWKPTYTLEDGLNRTIQWYDKLIRTEV